MTLGPGLTHSDSERCCFSPTLLENDPSVSQQVDLYLLHGSYCKIARFCGKHQPENGDFALRQNPLRGNSEQSTLRIKGSQRNGEELTFQTRCQTFNDPGLLQKLNLSFKSVFSVSTAGKHGRNLEARLEKKRFGPLWNSLLIGQTDA